MSGTINSRSSGNSVRSSDVSRAASVATGSGSSGGTRPSGSKPLVIPPDIKPALAAKASAVREMLKSNKDPVQALRNALANPEIFKGKKK